MARRTKEEAEQTRQAVLDAALNIFYEKGFCRTTFDEIAKRINLTKGAVYWHFRNKADLLSELMRQKFSLKNNELKGVIKPPSTLAELREAMRIHAQSIESDFEFQKFLFFIIFQMEWSETICQRVGQQVREIRDFPLQQIKETLTLLQKSGEIVPETNIDELSLIMLCMWRGTTNAFISRNIPFNFTTNILKSFDLIIDGLKVEKK